MAAIYCVIRYCPRLALVTTHAMAVVVALFHRGRSGAETSCLDTRSSGDDESPRPGSEQAAFSSPPRVWTDASNAETDHHGPAV